MNTLKLLDKEIVLNKADLQLLKILERNLREDENYSMREATAIKELEALGVETAQYIELAKKYSENIKNGKINPEEIKKFYNKFKQIYMNVDTCIHHFITAFAETKIKEHKILKELEKLQKDINDSSKDIYEFLAKESTSKYIK